jgi:hypothetical protein
MKITCPKCGHNIDYNQSVSETEMRTLKGDEISDLARGGAQVSVPVKGLKPEEMSEGRVSGARTVDTRNVTGDAGELKKSQPSAKGGALEQVGKEVKGEDSTVAEVYNPGDGTIRLGAQPAQQETLDNKPTGNPHPKKP